MSRITESSLRRIIRKVLFEVTDKIEKFTWDDYTNPTKYSYSYMPLTGELRFVNLERGGDPKIIKQNTPAWTAIVAQYEEHKDDIHADNLKFAHSSTDSIEIEPSGGRQNIKNLLSRRAFNVISDVFDPIEEFLSRCADGEFGDEIKNHLEIGYPNYNTDSGITIRHVVPASSDKDANPIQGVGQRNDYVRFINLISPNNKRLIGLQNFMQTLQSRLNGALNVPVSLNDLDLASAVLPSAYSDDMSSITAAAKAALAQSTNALSVLYKIFNEPLKFGGQDVSEAEQDDVAEVFIRSGIIPPAAA